MAEKSGDGVLEAKAQRCRQHKLQAGEVSKPSPARHVCAQEWEMLRHCSVISATKPSKQSSSHLPSSSPTSYTVLQMPMHHAGIVPFPQLSTSTSHPYQMPLVSSHQHFPWSRRFQMTPYRTATHNYMSSQQGIWTFTPRKL